METITLGLNELGQICIDQHGNKGRLTHTKTFEATDDLMRLLMPHTTDPSKLRLFQTRLRVFYQDNDGIDSPKPDLHIVPKHLDKAIGQE